MLYFKCITYFIKITFFYNVIYIKHILKISLSKVNPHSINDYNRVLIISDDFKLCIWDEKGGDYNIFVVKDDGLITNMLSIKDNTSNILGFCIKHLMYIMTHPNKQKIIIHVIYN